MLRPIIYIVCAVLAAILSTGCRDDYFDQFWQLDGEGDAHVSLLVDFMPLAENNTSSRATTAPKGDCMKDIEDMCIVIFNNDSTFREIINVTEDMFSESDEERNPSDAPNGILAGETYTKRRTLTLNLRAGRCYMYAVANLNDAGSTYDYLVNDCKIADMKIADFRAIRRTWDYRTPGSNSEMAGYFTDATKGIAPGSSVRSHEDGDGNTSIFVTNGMKMHCWLRRLASKVTVNFNAEDLARSTTIYIKEIRIKDIPYDCSLLDYNRATADVDKEHGLLNNTANAQKIEFSGSKDYTGWPYLTSGRTSLDAFQDRNNIGHDNDDYSLFFYENMQGRGESKHQDADLDGYIDDPDSTDPNNEHYKDAMKAGTYIEIKAYYVSEAAGNEGSGDIYYRFMLGADADFDYNAERNHHYKLTLTFHGYANDYDWHIEYQQEQTPITVPNPYYISYGYNQSLELPITVMGEIVDNTVTATILRNDWWPSVQWVDVEADKSYHFDRTLVEYSPEDQALIRKYRKAAYDRIITHDYYADPQITEAERKERRKPLQWLIAKEGDTIHHEGVAFGFLSLRKTFGDVIGDEFGSAKAGYLGIWDDWTGVGTQDAKGNDDRNKRTGTAKFIPGISIDGIDETNRSLGRRVYTFTDENHDKVYDDGENADDKDGSYRIVVDNGANKQARKTTMYLPLYTRQKNIVKRTAYTGENPYDTEQRRAKVLYSFKVKVTDKNGEERIVPVDTIIDIVQVTKIGNPTGIWRRWNNAAPFDVVLKIKYGQNATEYRDLESHGGWSAEVEYGMDWVMLNGGKRKIYGNDGDPIAFTYRPAGTLLDENKVRCGIILVKYHNYTCNHRIFVRQGYAPIFLVDNANDNGEVVYWHSANMVTKEKEADSPLDEGSMFRYPNWDQPIDACMNVNDSYPNPWINYNQDDFLDHANTDFKIAGKYKEDNKTQVTAKWDEIASEEKMSGYKWNIDGNDKERTFNFKGKKCRLLEIDDIVRIRQGGDERVTHHSFGVLYGDNTTATGTTIDEAWGYKSGNTTTETYGMRGCFVYNKNNGKNIFFPIGASGYGHRKAYRSNVFYYTNASTKAGYTYSGKTHIPNKLKWLSKPGIGTGVLRYASGRITQMLDDDSKYQPLLYDLYRRQGAFYWANTIGRDDTQANENEKGGRTAMDLNYFSFDFNTLGNEPFGGDDGKGSDACFIRLVEIR